MDILLSALAGAQQELLLLEGHALAGRWKEAEFTDNVEAGLLRYGSSLRDAKEKVFNLKVKLSQVKLDAAAAAAGAPRGLSEEEHRDAMVRALPHNAPGIVFLDRDGKPHKFMAREAAYLDKLAVHAMKLRRLLPVADSAPVGGLSAAQEELREMLTGADSTVDALISEITSYSHDLVVANKHDWDTVEEWRHGMGSQGLTEDEDKALRKIVQRKVEEKRAGAAVAAAVSAVTKEVTGGAKRGHWQRGGDEAQDASGGGRQGGPTPPKFGAYYPSSGRSRFAGGR